VSDSTLVKRDLITASPFAESAAVNILQYISPAVITVMAVQHFIWEFLVIKLKECFHRQVGRDEIQARGMNFMWFDAQDDRQ
jgi:hypothetical protein